MPLYQDVSELPGVGLGIDDAQEIMKEFYLDRMRDNVDTDTIMWSMLTKTADDVEGKEIVMSHKMRKSSGFGFQTGRNPLPDAHHQQNVNGRFSMTKFYIRFRLEQMTISATRTNRGAFVRAIDDEVVSNTRFAKKYLNQEVFNDGSGRLAIVSDVTDAATGVLVLRHTHDPLGQVPWADPFEIGDVVGIVNASASAANFGAQGFLGTNAAPLLKAWWVIGVDYDAGSITLGDAYDASSGYNLTTTEIDDTTTHAVAVGDAIVKVIHRDTNLHTVTASSAFAKSTSYRAHATTTKVMMGALGIINSGGVFIGYNSGASVTTDLQQISADDYPRWASVVFAGNGSTTQQLTNNLIQRSIDVCEKRGKGKIGVFVMSYGVHRAYEENVMGDKRYNDTTVIPGGWTVITHNGRPMIPESDCPPGTWLNLDLTSFKVARMAPLDFMDADAVWTKVPGLDEYEATAFMYQELYTDNRAGCSRLQNVQES